MRWHLGCVVATALLALKTSAQVKFVTTFEALSGVYGDPLLANQQYTQEAQEIPLQHAADEKIKLLRGATTEPASSPSIDKTMHFKAGNVNEAKVIDAAVPWGNLFPQPDDAKNRVTDKHEYLSDRGEVDVDAGIDPSKNAGGIDDADLSSQSESEPSGVSEENGLKTMVVSDVSVRWDQDDCNPCEIPTQVPTLAPVNPHGDDNYEDHLPIVADDYEPWEELTYTDAPTEIPPRYPNYPPREGDYEEHLPIVNDEYDSWDELKENLQPYINVPTDTPTQSPDTIPPPEDSTSPENTTAPPKDTVAPEDATEPLKDTARPENTTPPKETNAPETPAKDTTAPENTIAPPKDTVAPEDTTAPPKDTTDTRSPADTTAPPNESTFKPYEPTPAPTKEEEPTPAPTGPNNEYAMCPIGQQSIGVAGWDHDGCVISGNVCIANTFGDCPNGGHCAWLDTGVYGCKDGEGCSSNDQTIGVVGWDHDGCIVSDNVCVDQVSDGDCPGGAYCALLDTGVYGCIANPTPAPTRPYDWVPADTTMICPSGQQSIGVTGWDHDGCVTSDNVCVAHTYGDCPKGAHCAWLDMGVYGCKDGEGCSDNEQTIGVVGWNHDGCIVSNNVCADQVSNGDCPGGTYCALLKTGVYGCVASSKKPAGAAYDTGKTSSGTVTRGKSTSGTSGKTTNGGTTGGLSAGTTPASTSKYSGGIASANTGTATTGSPSDTLSAGSIAGIAIACVVFVAVVVGAVIFRQKALARQHEENLFADLSDTGGGDYVAM